MHKFDSENQIFTVQVTSSKKYADPIRDLSIKGKIVAPDGRTSEHSGFWDGKSIWCVRVPVDLPGIWHYEVICSDEENRDLHGQPGTVEVEPYAGDNPLLRHGPVKVSANRRHLIYGDGTPFFWLADTAWNGVLKAQQNDWDRYLSRRREQGFTCVQAVLTQWRAFKTDSAGETAFLGREKIRINPAFYQRIDSKVASIARHGLVPALVLIWSCTPSDPGHYLDAEDLEVLARYEVARYAAYRPVWLLGGDGEYRNENATKWLKTGRAVFSEHSDQLVTMHPRGQNWPNEDFRGEPWFSFASYQSGHGDSAESLAWLTQGPPARHWNNNPLVPIINQEPNYEHHVSYQHQRVFGAREVRRALYWSLLISPTSGVTYGHHGIWPWMEQRGVPLDHPRSGEAPAWWEALESEGATSVTHLCNFFRGIEWWQLRPSQEWLATQPGNHEPERFIAVATSEDGNFAVAYSPCGDDIVMNQAHVGSYTRAEWFDPRSGNWHEASCNDDLTFCPPDDQDWVLLLRRPA